MRPLGEVQSIAAEAGIGHAAAAADGPTAGGDTADSGLFGDGPRRRGPRRRRGGARYRRADAGGVVGSAAVGAGVGGAAVERMWFCDACSAQCTSYQAFRDHQGGARHAAGLRRQQEGLPPPPPPPAPLRCDTCGVITSSQATMNDHLAGRRHAAALQQQAWQSAAAPAPAAAAAAAGTGAAPAAAAPPPSWTCRLCNLAFPSSAALSTHQNGRRHSSAKLWRELKAGDALLSGQRDGITVTAVGPESVPPLPPGGSHQLVLTVANAGIAARTLFGVTQLKAAPEVALADGGGHGVCRGRAAELPPGERARARLPPPLPTPPTPPTPPPPPPPPSIVPLSAAPLAPGARRRSHLS